MNLEYVIYLRCCVSLRQRRSVAKHAFVAVVDRQGQLQDAVASFSLAETADRAVAAVDVVVVAAVAAGAHPAGTVAGEAWKRRRRLERTPRCGKTGRIFSLKFHEILSLFPPIFSTFFTFPHQNCTLERW